MPRVSVYIVGSNLHATVQLLMVSILCRRKNKAVLLMALFVSSVFKIQNRSVSLRGLD